MFESVALNIFAATGQSIFGQSSVLSGLSFHQVDLEACAFHVLFSIVFENC